MVTDTEMGKDTVGGEKEMPLATESRTKAHRELAVTSKETPWEPRTWNWIERVGIDESPEHLA